MKLWEKNIQETTIVIKVGARNYDPRPWIGWNGPLLWPARSPDLTCLDYFLWWYIKSLVYETPVNSAENLVARITAAADEVRDTPGILANVRSSMFQRCQACITARGRNFEHLL